ncbi:vWA domain-containing protein [Allomesorhizobium camelthorni]|uniref:VWA domain-containing protein n=1 Tax=Allomesorhizobium camelthorni TaxID=475069 RepID=A0A6G4WBN7_9HYPH|nr:VWA domain-containing protein [Mesorhizobium camelthorni]NGO52181.1 VWA domain-containing protein [Mesorhizobium camelthorni]
MKAPAVRPHSPAFIAAELLAGFPAALREAGLVIDPGRAVCFLQAARAAPPRGISDLARIGRVTLTGSPADFPIYDAVFEAWFGQSLMIAAAPDEDDEAPKPSSPRGDQSRTDPLEGDTAGKAAADDLVRGRKNFGRVSDADAQTLARIRRKVARLPHMQSRNWTPSPRGPRIDLARTCRAARATFGETLRMTRMSRPERPRKLLLLIDVSGSMKAQSEIYLRFAHLLVRERPRVECFCFGTSLSRVTAMLKHRDPDQALGRLADMVFDFDGGTRIGSSLEEFLSVSRHAALVRGAVTVLLSDGLERGDPAEMVHAVERIARLSHRLVWATPLAADPRYRPLTRAMAGILPHLDDLCDAGSLGALDRLFGRLDAVEHGPRGQATRRFSITGIAA